MNKKWIIIILVAIIFIIAVGIALYYILVQQQPTEQADQPAVEEGAIFHTGKVFITNLLNGHQLLKTDIFIRVPREDVRILEQNAQLVRDRIIRVLRGFTEEDILLDELQDVVRDRIKNDLQNTLNIDRIIDVYFTEFVVQ